MVDGLRALGVVALTCALSLTACTPDGSAPPTPSPTPASQSPTETAQERQQRIDYAAAEKSYRTFRAEYNRVLRAGGAKEPTKVMKETAGGPYLADLGEIVQAYKGINGHDEGKEVIRYVRPDGYDNNSIIFDVCEDGRAITSVSSSGNFRGELRIANLTVKRVDNTWKVWTGTGKKVKECT